MSKKNLIAGLKRSTRGKCYGLTKVQITKEELFHDKNEHELYFFVFDGFAYCPNYNGKVYMVKDLPRRQYFIDHKEEAEDILKENDIKAVTDITPFMILQFYGNITEEGNTHEEDLNINYDEEDKMLEAEEAAYKLSTSTNSSLPSKVNTKRPIL